MESIAEVSSPTNGVLAAMTPIPEREPVNIWDRAVCLVVNIGCIGNTKKVKKGELEVKSAAGNQDPEADAIRTSKELMVSPELDAVRKKISAIRSHLYDNCVPSMLKAGSYMVAIGKVTETEKKLKDFASEFAPLVMDVRRAYAQRKSEGMARLGDLAREEDYLTDEQLAKSFVFEWRWVAFSTPKKLQAISPEFFEQQKAEAEKHWKQATEQMQDVMRAAMKELVDHMVERLSPADDGKKKTFHASTVESLAKFLSEFEIKNITDDKELKGLVDQAASILGTVGDVKSLRKDEDLRNAVRLGMQNVQAKLDELVVNAGSRMISFEDEG